MDFDDETTEQPVAELDPASASAPAAAAEKRTAEHWARAKGMLPEFSDGPRLPNMPSTAKPPQIHNPKFAHFHATKIGNRWPIGMELTEAEFDAAIAETQGHVFR